MRDPGNLQETVCKLEGLGFRLGLRQGGERRLPRIAVLWFVLLSRAMHLTRIGLCIVYFKCRGLQGE